MRTGAPDIHAPKKGAGDITMPSHDTRSGGNFRGFTPSIKNACSMPWYSLAEEASTLLLEFSPEVLRFRSAQDRTFLLRESGQTFRYTPDYEIVRRDGSTVFVEAKPAKDLQLSLIHI